MTDQEQTSIFQPMTDQDRADMVQQLADQDDIYMAERLVGVPFDPNRDLDPEIVPRMMVTAENLRQALLPIVTGGSARIGLDILSHLQAGNIAATLVHETARPHEDLPLLRQTRILRREQDHLDRVILAGDISHSTVSLADAPFHYGFDMGEEDHTALVSALLSMSGNVYSPTRFISRPRSRVPEFHGMWGFHPLPQNEPSSRQLLLGQSYHTPVSPLRVWPPEVRLQVDPRGSSVSKSRRFGRARG